MSIHSQRGLAVILSKLSAIDRPLLALEQYQTPSEIAADWLWQAAMQRDIAGKIILDAGCGNGILGIGALLLGAKTVHFLDKSQEALVICAENIKKIAEEFEIGEYALHHQDISLFDEAVDVVLQNPPFGTKIEHSDKRFLESAFSVAPIIYSMHKWTTKPFVEAISTDQEFTITHLWRYEFPIVRTFEFHTKPKVMVDVGLWRLQRNITPQQ